MFQTPLQALKSKILSLKRKQTLLPVPSRGRKYMPLLLYVSKLLNISSITDVKERYSTSFFLSCMSQVGDRLEERKEKVFFLIFWSNKHIVFKLTLNELANNKPFTSKSIANLVVVNHNPQILENIQHMFFSRQSTACQIKYKGKSYLFHAHKVVPCLMEEADIKNK